MAADDACAASRPSVCHAVATGTMVLTAVCFGSCGEQVLDILCPPWYGHAMEQVRIAFARGTYDLERSLIPRGGPPILVLGLAQHPKVRCWCTSVRWWGSPMRWTSAHRYKNDAEAQIERACIRLAQADITDPLIFEAWAKELAAEGDAELWAACEDAGRQVLATIWKIMQQDAQVRDTTPPEH
jgi:hypothetical protein